MILEGSFLNLILDILRGIVIGLANIIPGVSGGTMMVAMGIYDKLISAITHLFKEMKKSILIVAPYLIGMAIAIVVGAFGLKAAFAHFPLPTNALFIGLILGSLPMILKEMKGERKGIPGIVLFVGLFALVVILKMIETERVSEIHLNVLEVIKIFALGCIASATMVIPGVSGSMMLKTLGYYEPIYIEGVHGIVTALTAGNWSLVVHYACILIPFVIGIVAGIIGVAKLMEKLLRDCKGITYCAILGMVAASPVVILMDQGLYANLSFGMIAASVVCFVLGCAIAFFLGGEKEHG